MDVDAPVHNNMTSSQRKTNQAVRPATEDKNIYNARSWPRMRNRLDLEIVDHHPAHSKTTAYARPSHMCHLTVYTVDNSRKCRIVVWGETTRHAGVTSANQTPASAANRLTP